MSVTILEDTTHFPIQMIGKYSGLCWGSDITDSSKNYKRGLECLSNNHGRTLEFPQIYILIDDYSARVMRELYTHIGGMPTRLQESTRYVSYNGFSYTFLPDSYEDKIEQKYEQMMEKINLFYTQLLAEGVSKEDAANILPLGMSSKMVLRTNLRQLIDMSHSRLCNRAYWEFRKLMNEICRELSNYDEEYKYIVENYFKPKCEIFGYCEEKYSCGKFPQRNL